MPLSGVRGGTIYVKTVHILCSIEGNAHYSLGGSP